MNFESSTVCPVLPGLMGLWQKRLGKMGGWNTNQSQPNPGPRAYGTPCRACVCSAWGGGVAEAMAKDGQQHRRSSLGDSEVNASEESSGVKLKVKDGDI